MSNFSNIYGTVKINDIDCGFTLEKFTLKIELQDGVELNINKFDNSVKLPFEMLEGNIHNQAKLIRMYFNNYGYGFSSAYKNISTENLIIPLRYYVILEDVCSGEDISIKFINNSFEKWIGIYPIHNYKNLGDKMLDEVTLSYKPCSLKSNFYVNNKEYAIHPDVSSKGNMFSFNHKVCLKVDCLNTTDFEDIFNISKIIMKLVAYCYYRSDISLGVIEIVKKNKNNITSKVGDFYFNYNEAEIERIDLNKLNDFGFIPWSCFYKHVPHLVGLLEQNELFLYNLPQRRKERFRCSIVDISKDAAAFEYEFNKTFPDYKTCNLEDETHLSLHEKIWKIELDKEERSLLHATDYLFNSPSFKEKTLYALHVFGNIISEYLNGMTNEQIAKEFKDARNNADHGNMELSISDDTARVFYIIRIVIMSMQLKRMQVPDDEIPNLIRPVFSLDYNRGL